MPLSKIQDIDNQVIPNLGRRNLLINGAMIVWQRGTTIDTITTGKYFCDQWRIVSANLDGNVDIDQSTDVPSGQGFGFSQKVSVDASESSLDSNDNLKLQQKFEGQNLQLLAKGTSAAKKNTISFWVKSSVASTYTVEFVDNNNNRQLSKSYAINSADTWEHKTLTFEGDTSGSLTNNTNVSMTLNIYIDAGSDLSSGTFNNSAWGNTDNTRRVFDTTGWLESTSPEFYLTGVQWELGDTATDFEHRSFAEELLLCQRYFYREQDRNSSWFGYVGFADSGTNAYMQHHHPVEMRGEPSMTTTGTAGDYSIRRAGNTIGCSNVPSLSSTSRTVGHVLWRVASGLSSGQAVTGKHDAANHYIDWSSEL